MTPLQKAEEILQRFEFEVRDLDKEVSHTKSESIQCAIIHVEELDKELGFTFLYGDKRRVYYREVMQELISFK